MREENTEHELHLRSQPQSVHMEVNGLVWIINAGKTHVMSAHLRLGSECRSPDSHGGSKPQHTPQPQGATKIGEYRRLTGGDIQSPAAPAASRDLHKPRAINTRSATEKKFHSTFQNILIYSININSFTYFRHILDFKH